MFFLKRYFLYLKGLWSLPSSGIGDTVAKITKSFGIKPCSACERRRKKFNELVKYRRGLEERARERS